MVKIAHLKSHCCLTVMNELISNVACHCNMMQIKHYMKLKELLEKQKLKGQQPLEIRMESGMVNKLWIDSETFKG